MGRAPAPGPQGPALGPSVRRRDAHAALGAARSLVDARRHRICGGSAARSDGQGRQKAASGAQFRHRRARKSGRNSVTIKARNASVAIIGAGDYIGAAIAQRFAREGFIVKVGSRGGEKLQPPVDEIRTDKSREGTESVSSVRSGW